MREFKGSDWTEIATRLGSQSTDDEDCHKYITERLHTPEAEREIRQHLQAMINHWHADTLGYEKNIWDALLSIPAGEPAFIRMAYPLIRMMWV